MLDRIGSELPDTYVRIISRIKTAESIIAKIDKKRQEKRRGGGGGIYGLKDITDIVGLRLVCHFQSDIEKAVRVLVTMIKTRNGLDKSFPRGGSHLHDEVSKSIYLG